MVRKVEADVVAHAQQLCKQDMRMVALDAFLHEQGRQTGCTRLVMGSRTQCNTVDCGDANLQGTGVPIQMYVLATQLSITFTEGEIFNTVKKYELILDGWQKTKLNGDTRLNGVCTKNSDGYIQCLNISPNNQV